MYSQIFETLELKDDILYSTVRSNVCSGEKTRRIAIPYRLRDTTFYWAHKHVCAGHFGHAATTLRAQTRFYYPGMHNDIKGRVNSCQTCLAKQTKADIKKGTHQARKPGYPGECLSIDLIGPLPVTNKMNKYILSCEDEFTRTSIT